MSFLNRAIAVFVIPMCLSIATANAQNSKSQPDPVVGIWRGESLCTTNAPACHNEKVVYYIEAIPDKSDAMSIRADKIVDGRPITMGSGPWKYDRTKQTLSMEISQRLWLLNIHGKRIEGTLTVPTNVVFRRMTLTKDE